MNSRLYLSPLAEVTQLGDDKIALSVVGRRFTVEDRAGMIKSILEHAQDGIVLDQLTSTLSAVFPASAVEAAVKSLAQTKVLVSHDARSRGDATHQHLAHRREADGQIGVDPASTMDSSTWMVALAGKGALADALAQALIDMDVPVTRLSADTTLPAFPDRRCMLVACADYENFAQSRQLNQQAIAHNMTSLYLGIDWTTVQCGPLVIPKATACYECYFHRVRATRRFVAEFDSRAVADNVLYHALPSKLAIQWAVAEASRMVMRYLSGTLENLHLGQFCEIDSFSGEVQRSLVLRLPRCPVCGTANTGRPVGTAFLHAQLRRKG
ncbi:TOMM precursor leader peptide-binding protein [Parachitinimonas caeni]|uniref:TOMM leader peptide-binding protein n=1 Tax=Parachitinimonas caeni TaxID=3031301 RepID=A0ABT7DT69_9NEIS|nr:TOMM precursor leader peptide-binding protein [Parachitinimonas caeni]MDK2123271.1 TOMM precursor leader peptide-binding protein [Parachitinimonas caeni]